MLAPVAASMSSATASSATARSAAMGSAATGSKRTVTAETVTRKMVSAIVSSVPDSTNEKASAVVGSIVSVVWPVVSEVWPVVSSDIHGAAAEKQTHDRNQTQQVLSFAAGAAWKPTGGEGSRIIVHQCGC